jgi:hypothetical protein
MARLKAKRPKNVLFACWVYSLVFLWVRLPFAGVVLDYLAIAPCSARKRNAELVCYFCGAVQM